MDSTLINLPLVDSALMKLPTKDSASKISAIDIQHQKIQKSGFSIMNTEIEDTNLENTEINEDTI